MTAGARRPSRIAAVVLGGLALLLALGYVGLRLAFPPERLAALIAEQAKAATGRDLRIGGGLSLRVLPSIAVVATDVALGNADWGSRPDMVRVRRAAFNIEWRPLLRREVHILGVDVDGVDALFESDGRGRFNWVLAPAEPPVAGSPAQGQRTLAIDLQRLAFSDARIAYRDGASGATRAVVIPSLTVQASGERDRISARFQLGGPVWHLDGSVGRLHALSRGEDDWPFDLRLSAAGVTATAAGHAGVGARSGVVQAQVAARIDDATALGAALPGVRAVPLPFELGARLDRAAGRVDLDDLRMAIAGQVLQGRLTWRLVDDKPAIEGELSASDIDVARWLPAASTRVPAAAAGAHAVVFDDEPLAPIALPPLPVDLGLRIGQLRIAGAPSLTKLALRLHAEPDRLRLEQLSFDVAGGSATGRLELALQAKVLQTVALQIDARSLALQELRAGASQDSGFRGGRLSLRADLEMAGASARSLAGSSSGSVLLSVADVVVAGGAGVLGSNVGPQLLNALIPGQADREGLTVRCAVARLPLRHGVATIDRSIGLETDQLAVSASGELNLAAQSVALAFRPEVKQGLGLNPATLAGLVTLKGPLADPRISIDAGGVVREAAGVGVAVATGGLSLLAHRLVADKSGDIQACRRAADTTSGSTVAPAKRRSR